MVRIFFFLKNTSIIFVFFLKIKIITPPQNSGNSIELNINGELLSSNKFTFTSSGIPVISSLDISSSSPSQKRDIIITGTNFGTDKKQFGCFMDTTTLFPAYTLDIIDSTATKITCRLKGGKIGTYTMRISKNGIGSSGVISANVNVFKYELNVSSISPNVGSKAGGTILTITGVNFSPIKNQNQVFIGAHNIPCIVTEATKTQLKCLTGPSPPTYSGQNTVIVAQRIVNEAICTGTCKFTYSDLKTPNITLNKNIAIDVSSGKIISIKGEKFGTNIAKIKVVINNVNYDALTVIDTKIQFKMPPLVEGVYKLEIMRENFGKAAGGPIILKNQFLVQSISPIEGSRGCSEITISGSGFNANAVVYLDSFLLDIISYESNKIIAFLPKNNYLINQQQYEIKVYTNESKNSYKTCANCKYKALDSHTATISSHNGFAINLTTSTFEFTVTGTNFDVSGKAKAFAYLPTFDQMKKKFIFKSIGIIKNKLATSLTVEFSNLAAGKYFFRLEFEGKGFAISNSKYSLMKLNPKDTTISNLKASYAGGAILTATGGGFFTDVKYRNTSNDIRLCGFKCIPLTATFSEITCRIPLVLTSNSIAKYNLKYEEKLKYNVKVLSSTYKAKYLSDKKTSTYYALKNENCFILLDFGENMEIKITKINYFLAMNIQTKRFYKSFFEASNDNINWELLFRPEFLVTEWNKWVSPQAFHNKRFR